MLITATISEISAKEAVLSITKTRQVTLPPSCLPKNSKVGQSVSVEILSRVQQQARQKNIAQAILDEILKGNGQNQNASQNSPQAQ